MRCVKKMACVAVVGMMVCAAAPAMAGHVPPTGEQGSKHVGKGKHLTPQQKHAAKKAHRRHHRHSTTVSPGSGGVSGS